MSPVPTSAWMSFFETLLMCEDENDSYVSLPFFTINEVEISIFLLAFWLPFSEIVCSHSLFFMWVLLTNVL